MVLLLRVLIHVVRLYLNSTKSGSIFGVIELPPYRVFFDNFVMNVPFIFMQGLGGNFVKNRSILYSGSLKLFKWSQITVIFVGGSY